MTRAEAHKFCLREDQGRARYLKKYFNADIDDPLLYHMIINTGQMDYHAAAKLIGEAVLNPDWQDCHFGGMEIIRLSFPVRPWVGAVACGLIPACLAAPDTIQTLSRRKKRGGWVWLLVLVGVCLAGLVLVAARASEENCPAPNSPSSGRCHRWF